MYSDKDKSKDTEMSFEDAFIPNEEVDELYAVFIEALNVFKEHYVHSDITTFLKLVTESSH